MYGPRLTTLGASELLVMPATYIISAEEWQLLAFFEVEPTKLDADVAWPYNDFTFRRALGEVTVTFGIAPAYKDFTLIVERGGAKEIELSALSVFDIRYHEDRGAEWLEILLTESDRLELRLKPSFSLTGQLRLQA
jgi:hypothetical protein